MKSQVKSTACRLAGNCRSFPHPTTGFTDGACIRRIGTHQGIAISPSACPARFAGAMQPPGRQQAPLRDARAAAPCMTPVAGVRPRISSPLQVRGRRPGQACPRWQRPMPNRQHQNWRSLSGLLDWKDQPPKQHLCLQVTVQRSKRMFR